MTYKDKGSYESSPPCRYDACQTYDWVELQLWMRHATRMNESLAQDAQLNTSSLTRVEWYTYEHVMPHLWMSHVTRMNEACWIERWGAGVETQKNVRGEIEGWGRVPFNEPYAPSLITIYDGA